MRAPLAAMRAVWVRLRRRWAKRGPTTAAKPLILALTHSPHTKIALRVSMFREEWQCVIATSLEQALRLLDRYPIETLIYDLDCGEGDWHSLCIRAVRDGIGFQLVASAPDDDLFFAVLGAGGAGVLPKPVTTEQLVAAIHFSQSLSRRNCYV